MRIRIAFLAAFSMAFISITKGDGNWEILLSKTKFKCGSITNCPAPAMNAFNVHGNEWIVSVVDGGYLKMVKLKVTGENSYDWMETKYNKDGEYDKSKCADSFSEECFVQYGLNLGWAQPGDVYKIDLYARKKEVDNANEQQATPFLWEKYVAGECIENASWRTLWQYAGWSCADYAANKWCENGGVGSTWDSSWPWSEGADGRTAQQVCCVCGGDGLPEYTKTTGACRGGNNPENMAGSKFFTDKNCLDRCRKDPLCTGYLLPTNGANWCETYTSAGATGDGRQAYDCYTKAKPLLRNVCGDVLPTDMKSFKSGCHWSCADWAGLEGSNTYGFDFCEDDWSQHKHCVPFTVGKVKDYCKKSCNNCDLADFTKSAGACRGGESPENNAGKKSFDGFTAEDCKKGCENNPSCSGYNLPMDGSNSCETFTSVGVTGDGQTTYECWTKGKSFLEVVHQPTDQRKVVVQLDRRQGQCCNSALQWGGKIDNGCDMNRDNIKHGPVGRLWKENVGTTHFEVSEWECEQICKDTSEDIVACMFWNTKCWLYPRQEFGNTITGGNNNEYYTCWLRKDVTYIKPFYGPLADCSAAGILSTITDTMSLNQKMEKILNCFQQNQEKIAQKIGFGV